MTSKKYILFAISLIATISLTSGPGLAQEPPPSQTPPVTSPAIIPGEVIVKFQPHVGLAAAQGSLQAEGLQSLEASSASGTIKVEVPPGREAEAIAELTARGDVEFAAFNYRVEALEEPNDPGFSLQWSLNQLYDHDIDAPEGWNVHAGTGSVTIAVIDTGADMDHPDLAANIVPGWDFVNGDGNPDDDHYGSHGTHVAGIAAAIGNNGQGIAGVSWGAKIMPLKVLSASGSGSSYDVAQAIYYAVNNGARVINMSLGATGSAWPCNWTYVEDALNYAVSNGVLMVVAAGNDGQYGVNCPGAYDQVMAVGATTSSDTRAYYSNYGPRLDIAAPGDSIYSTLYGGSYGYKSGTSMATPHVAGLSALIWSLAPSLTDQEVRSIIESTANDLGTIGWDQYYGHGRINVANALGIQVPVQSTGIYLPEGEISASSTEINIPINTFSPEPLNWSATIEPNVAWLVFTSPNSGTVSAGSPAAVTLQGIFQPAYEEPSTNVIVTATSASGEFVLNTTTTVQRFSYQIHLPLLFKNAGP